MRVAIFISVAAVLAAGCSADWIVNNDEPRPQAPVLSTRVPPPPPPNNAHVVDAFDYVAHPAGEAVYYFTTPSGRWACAIVPRVKAGCQSATSWQSGMGISGEPETVPDASGAPAAPNALIVERGGEPRFVAADRPEFVGENAKVLEFNRILVAAGFRCNVQESGVSCMSESSGNGFTFAPERFTPQYTEVPATAP